MNRKRNVLSLALAILVGGFAIHGLLVACSGKSAGSADAQGSAGSCRQWAFFEQSDTSKLTPGPMLQINDASSGGYVYTYLAPEGWEPVSNGGSLSSTAVLFRRCVQ
jgi:hypothetical protein